MKKLFQLLTLTALLTQALSAGQIHDAVRNGNLTAVQQLLANGASVNAQDNYGCTPLHWAAWMGNTEVAKLLIAKNANVNVQDKYNRTPLHSATIRFRGAVEIAELLIAKGANVDAQDDDEHWTPLHFAAWMGNTEVAKLLIAKNANVNVQDKYNRTPLQIAKEERRIAIVELLTPKTISFSE